MNLNIVNACQSNIIFNKSGTIFNNKITISGSRFGLMMVKVGIAQTIRNFDIVLHEKTIQPLKYDPIYFTLYPKGGVWFNCKKLILSE